MSAHPALLTLLVVASFSAAPAYAARTGTIGLQQGSPAALTCPDKAYLAGVSVWMGASLQVVHPYCAGMAADGTWSGGARLEHGLKMGGTGSRGDFQADLFCPMDSFVFGFSGYSMAHGLRALNQLKIVCRNVKTGVLVAFETSGGMRGTSTEWRGAQCGDDFVADGVFGLVDHGNYVMQFGLSCAPTRPAYLQAREQARLKHGVVEQASVTPKRTPVSSAKTRAAAGLTGASAAPLASSAAVLTPRETPATASAPPATALDTGASPSAASGKVSPLAPRAAPAAPASGVERAIGPNVSRNAAQAQSRVIQPPEIIAPLENGSVRADTLRIQVRAAAVEGSAEVELSWVKGGPARWGSPVPTQWPTVPPIIWRAPMSDLVRGTVVPVSARPQLDGYYNVRVRSIGTGSIASDWSAPRWIYVSVDGHNDLATEAQSLPPRTSSAMPQPSRVRDWKQAPSTIGR
jgi:hypothetical protein